jgi:hypothetical protein
MPASTTIGTSGKRARSAFRPNRLLSPRPEPILGGVGKDVEALLAEDSRRLDEAKHIGLERIVFADDLELHPGGAEDLSPHLRGGDGLLDGMTARRVG